jgi:hypothetical protein
MAPMRALSEQALFFQNTLEFIGIESDELPVTDHDHRHALAAEFEETLLHFAGLGDIEVQEGDLIPLQPALEVLAMGTTKGRIDDHSGRFLY